MNASFRVSTVLIPAVCLLSGAIGAVMVWGRSSEERIQLTRRLNEFSQLTDEQQHMIRLSNADFHHQSGARRSEITAIFELTRENPQLRKTLDHYNAWWSSLSPEDWDRFREMSPDERLAFVQSGWTNFQQPQQEITIEFPGRDATRMPTLQLTFDEYARIISEAHAAVKKPESLEKELAALSSEKHRALRLTLWTFDNFPAVRDTGEMSQRGQQFVTAILKNARDEVWKKQFNATLSELSGRPFERAWLFMTIFTILEKATVTLGDHLREEFPVTQRQIIDAFASLQDKALQRSLMVMPADEARTRLELLAQTGNAQSPEQRLLAEYNRFAKDRGRIMRTLFGFGGPGSGPAPPDRSQSPVPGNGRRIPNGGRPPAEGSPRKNAPGSTSP